MTKDEYLSLIKEVKEHDRLYYEKSSPIITDSEYDQLYFKLQNFETHHPDQISPESPTQKFGADDSLAEITHPYPLLSLQKAQDYDTVEYYLQKFKSGKKSNEFSTDEFIVQLKEDGLTIALYFNWFKGQPFVASTRGSGGIKGQNVTQQMIAFKNFIKTDRPVIIRGEAIMTNRAFDKLNIDGEYMNARNAVSGLLHTKAPVHDVTFVAYNIENAEEIGITTEKKMLRQLHQWGFVTPSVQQPFANTKKGRQSLLTYLQIFEESNARTLIDHDIDGLVIKPNYLGNRRQLGHTSHHPRNQIAYKFASPDAKTVLRNVIWQIGAKGQVTPVGVFDPINLLGATITKASLANFGNIKKRDIRIGDHILVRRSNDVIPQITKSFKEERTGQEKIIKVPENTKFVGKHLFVKEQSEEQLLGRWKIFVSKQGFDLKNVSQKTIRSLAAHHLIDLTNFASLWRLDRTKMSYLPGWSDKKLNNLFAQLEKPFEITMDQFIFALAIKGIGQDTAKKISQLYPTPTAIVNNKPALSRSNWQKQVGKISEQLITNLQEHSVEIASLSPYVKILQTNNEQKLNQNVFVITGEAQNRSRAELTNLIEQNGGLVKKQVTSNTNYVIELTKGTISSKIKKAKELSIPIISEQEILDKISQ